jgi:hypothetical protein
MTRHRIERVIRRKCSRLSTGSGCAPVDVYMLRSNFQVKISWFLTLCIPKIKIHWFHSVNLCPGTCPDILDFNQKKVTAMASMTRPRIKLEFHRRVAMPKYECSGGLASTGKNSIMDSDSRGS